MSYALARGLLAAGLAVTAAMALGMIATIGGIAFAAAFARDRFMGVLARTESWRYRAGRVLEVGGSVLVLCSASGCCSGLSRPEAGTTSTCRLSNAATLPRRLRSSTPASSLLLGLCNKPAFTRGVCTCHYQGNSPLRFMPEGCLLK